MSKPIIIAYVLYELEYSLQCKYYSTTGGNAHRILKLRSFISLFIDGPTFACIILIRLDCNAFSILFNISEHNNPWIALIFFLHFHETNTQHPVKCFFFFFIFTKQSPEMFFFLHFSRNKHTTRCEMFHAAAAAGPSPLLSQGNSHQVIPDGCLPRSLTIYLSLNLISQTLSFANIDHIFIINSLPWSNLALFLTPNPGQPFNETVTDRNSPNFKLHFRSSDFCKIFCTKLCINIFGHQRIQKAFYTLLYVTDCRQQPLICSSTDQ